MHVTTLRGDRQAPVRSHHRLLAALVSLPIWDLAPVCAIPAHLRRNAPDARAQRHAVMGFQLCIPHRLVINPPSFARLHLECEAWEVLSGRLVVLQPCCQREWSKVEGGQCGFHWYGLSSLHMLVALCSRIPEIQRLTCEVIASQGR